MKRWMRAWVCGLGMAWSAVAGATAQIPDDIVVEGQHFALTTLPLSGYLQQRNDFLPADVSISSANWRGYVASWEISEDALYLVDVTVETFDQQTRKSQRASVRPKLFPGATRVLAQWYSGVLLIPDGKLVDYVHMGFGSTYDHYRIFRIESGRVTESLSLSQAEFERYRDRKFAAFQQTDEYAKALQDLRKDASELSPQAQESFLKSFYAETYLAR